LRVIRWLFSEYKFTVRGRYIGWEPFGTLNILCNFLFLFVNSLLGGHTFFAIVHAAVVLLVIYTGAHGFKVYKRMVQLNIGGEIRVNERREDNDILQDV